MVFNHITSGSRPPEPLVTNNKLPSKPSASQDAWYFPIDLKDDLKSVGLPDEFVAETLAYSWEYTKCIIPHYTNWARYIAYQRLIAVAVVAEYSGELMDVVNGSNILGYDTDALLHELFDGTPADAEMKLEFKASILFTADKSSNRRNSDLFRRYVNALAASPQQWFRLRDCDGLARFTIAAALACNDIYDLWFNNEQVEILCEIGLTMYDAVAYYKHRAEGETHSTFAYAGFEAREAAYRRDREVLWALDAVAAQDKPLQIAINFVRYLGGPIQTMMRRYRFVDEGLRLGVPETEEVVDDARRHVRLWNRVEQAVEPLKDDRYATVINSEQQLLFPGLVDMLRRDGEGHCKHCCFRLVYGAEMSGQFGGVELCEDCRCQWQEYLERLPARALAAFPVLRGWLQTSGE